MDQARGRVQLILDAYGHWPVIDWDDIVRVAVIRLHDLAGFSRQKAGELHKPHLLLEADAYDNDGHYLAALRCYRHRSAADGPQAEPPRRRRRPRSQRTSPGPLTDRRSVMMFACLSTTPRT